MSIVIFILSLTLLAAGAVSGYLSLDLLPTSVGILYAFAGAVAASMAIVTFALGMVVRRLNSVAESVRQLALAPAIAHVEPPELTFPVEPVEADPYAAELVEVEPVEVEPPVKSEHLAAEHEAPINENRAGRLPTLEAIEAAIETPEAPAALIGRYSSGGASYMIFADGSIEAETTEGAYKFASMGDFKHYLAERKEVKESGA